MVEDMAEEDIHNNLGMEEVDMLEDMAPGVILVHRVDIAEATVILKDMVVVMVVEVIIPLLHLLNNNR